MGAGIGRIIETDACVAEGAAWLAEADPRFAPALNDPLPLRRKPDGFSQLLSAIVSQQVSTASAAAIWARCVDAGLVNEDAVARASDEDLKRVGLSRPKQRYARALAAARLDYMKLRTQPTDIVIKNLVEVPGIGVWTAEIYAMLSLGRADVFASGDLALQEAARRLFGLDTRPRDRDLRQMAEAWSPWRSVAARALWAYYAAETRREGVR